MKLIVGLGNPGNIYSRNRHNIGFMCISYFARTQGIRLDKKQGQARTGTGRIEGNEVVLARPQTGMNVSGHPVSKLVNRFHISPDDLIIIYDDLDLPHGKIRIRQGGGSGGHNGLKSVIACLGTHDFIRIKVGIGRPDTAGSSGKDKEARVVAYVLSDFTPAEKITTAKVIPETGQAILCLLTEGLTAAMNKYN